MLQRLSRNAITLFLFLIAAGLIFADATRVSFLADDYSVIYRSMTEGTFAVLTRAPSIFFRPLIAVSFFADLSLWGLDARGFHLTNILFHGLNAFLVFQIARRIAVHTIASRAWN